MVGLIVAVHQHLLIGPADRLFGLLPILFFLLLLHALVRVGGAVPMGGAPEFLGRGAVDDLIGLLGVLLLGLGLRWAFIFLRLLPLVIPTRAGLSAYDVLEVLHDVFQGMALAGGLVLASEAAAVWILFVLGPAAITGVLKPEVGHDLEGQPVHWSPIWLIFRGLPVIGGHLHFSKRGHEQILLHVLGWFVVDDGPVVIGGPFVAGGDCSLREGDLLTVFTIGWRLGCLVGLGLVVAGRIGTGSVLGLLL